MVESTDTCRTVAAHVEGLIKLSGHCYL